MTIPTNKMGLLRAAVILGAASASAGAPSAAQADIAIQPLVLTGTQAPGLDDGVTFNSAFGSNQGLSFPILNNTGSFTFLADLVGSGVNNSNDMSVWSGDFANPGLVAREGATVPGLSPATYEGAVPRTLSDDGVLTYIGVFEGPGIGSGNETAFFRKTGSSTLILARSGDYVVDAPTGLVYGNLANTTSGLYASSGNHTAFRAPLLGSGVTAENDEAIVTISNGNTHILARKGSAAPGTTDSTFFMLQAPVVSESGVSAFQAMTLGESDGLRSGVWAGSATSGLRLVAKAGDAVPGEEGQTFPSVFSNPVVNAAGQAAFLTGSAFGFGPESVWSEGGGTLHRVVQAGDPAPGTEADTLFADFTDPLFNDAGDTAFLAALTGPSVFSNNRFGIFYEDNGSIELAARTGFSAPDTAPGVVFSELGNLVFNSAGQVAFTGTLTGPGVSFSNRTGVWATDSQGDLQLLFRDGDQIDVDASDHREDLRTISDFGYIANTGGSAGKSAGFSDLGQLGVVLQFTDGSEGIFIIHTDGSLGNLPADLDADGDVDDADFGLAFAAFTGPGGGPTTSPADLDSDGDVDDADFGLAFAAFTGPNATAAVPEPGSLVLIGLGGLLIVRRRRSA